MNKKLYEAIKNIDMEELGNYLDNEFKKCFLDSYLEGCYDGWYYNLFIDENGDFSYNRSSFNSMTMWEYEGRETVLVSMKANGSYEDEFISGGDIVDWQVIENELTLDQQQDLFVSVSFEREIMDLEEEELEKEEDFELDLFYCYQHEPNLVIAKFHELFPEICEELIKEDLEGNCWDMERELLLDKIYNKIELTLEYFEEYEDDEE